MGEIMRKAARHYRWLRTEGLARLVEEDRLDPVDRLRVGLAKARWRRAANRPAGSAAAVFVVGVQRSGTNMLVRGLDRAPEVEVHNENDRRAFHAYRLRSDDVVRDIVARSRHEFVLFKPLCDSHRTAGLLALGGPGTARAIWVYREVDGRVRSSVSKFGDSNLQALRRIAAGRGDTAWEAGGLEEPQIALLRGMPLDSMTPESASALFWYLRNDLYFSTGLHRRDDVVLVSYDAFLAAPEATMRALSSRIGFRYRQALVEGIAPRGAARPEQLQLDPRVRELCDEMQMRLDADSRRTLAA